MCRGSHPRSLYRRASMIILEDPATQCLHLPIRSGVTEYDSAPQRSVAINENRSPNWESLTKGLEAELCQVVAKGR